MGCIVERVESDLSTHEAHDHGKDQLEPCTLDHKGDKELGNVGKDQRGKDQEVAAPDLWAVLIGASENDVKEELTLN